MTKHQLKVEEILRKLISFNTVSSESNLELISFIEAHFSKLGIQSTRVVSDDGSKSNIFASVGPADTAGVILSGHTDVVPVKNQKWDTNPFELTKKVLDNQSRLYGRGSADMKGFIAAVMAMIPEFVNSDLKVPVHFSFSYDEEVGCRGVGRMIDKMCSELVLPKLVFIGEPTNMKIVTAHKGIQGFHTEVSGIAAHSSAPQLGVSAISYAAEIIQFLNKLSMEKQLDYDEETGFLPPWTTFNIGQITGGEALNIIPEFCSFNWEFRPLPNENTELIKERFDKFIEQEIQPRLKKENHLARVTTRPLASVPPLQAESSSAAEKLARRLTGANKTHTVSYVSEASLFQRSGIPAVLCGPGSIDQAHQANEWIAEEQLVECTKFLRRLLSWAKSGSPELG